MARTGQPIRVLYYEHPEPGMGGSRRSLLFLVRGLGNDVRPYIVGNLPPEVAKDLPAQAVVWKPPVGLWRRTKRGQVLKTLEWLAYTASVALRLAAVILRHRIDIVHVNNEPTNGAPAVLAAMLTGRPCVCHLRGTEPPWHETRWLFRRVRHYVAISEHVRDFYARQGLLDGKAVSVIYNGVDVQALERASRATPGEESRRFRAGWFGRMAWDKGFEHFLAAAAEVRKRTDDVEFSFHGHMLPPDDPGRPYIDRMCALRRELGLEDTVRFEGGYSDVAEVMHHTDVVLCTCEFDNFGRILFEAMACGVPVIAFDVGGTSEVVRSGVNGLLVPNKDAQAMADGVIRLKEDTELRTRIISQGRETARRLFDANTNASAVFEIYRTLTGSSTCG